MNGLLHACRGSCRGAPLYVRIAPALARLGARTRATGLPLSGGLVTLLLSVLHVELSLIDQTALLEPVDTGVEEAVGSSLKLLSFLNVLFGSHVLELAL